MTRYESRTRWGIICAALWVCLLPLPGWSVLIDSGDGGGNTSAPPDDPGWARMARRAPCPPWCGLTYFYLGQGWVLTAHHVGARDVHFEDTGRVCAKVPDSAREIGGAGGGVDLMLFRIRGGPDAPLFPIVRRPPPTGSEVLMIGRGRKRGSRLPGVPSPGWETSGPAQMRWGTNRVDSRGVSGATRLFWLRFDRPGGALATEHEAHATGGDSGGPVFVKTGGQWELAGIMVNASEPKYAEGLTGVVDLSHYRDEIMRIIAQGS
jgi:hypothetical protein